MMKYVACIDMLPHMTMYKEFNYVQLVKTFNSEREMNSWVCECVTLLVACFNGAFLQQYGRFTQRYGRFAH